MVEARPAGVKRAEASFPDINPFQRQVPVVTEMTMDEYLGHGLTTYRPRCGTGTTNAVAG